MISAELKAGMFVLIAAAVLVFMTTKLTQNQFSFRGTKKYYANIHDATGLLSKTKVKMAGLDVGQLTHMELAGTQARIQVEIAADMVLHADSSLAVKAIGFLGDKYLELSPGSPNKPVLEEGGYIQEGIASGSIDQLTQKTTQLVDSLKEIADTLKEALKGKGGQADGSRLDRILDNMEQFSEGLAEMDKLGDMADRLAEVADNVRDITARVNRGEGTVGKLLTDSETIDKINSTISGINKIVTKADRLQVKVDVHSAALTTIGGSRTDFSLAIQPTWDKYYLLGVTSRPQGVTTTKRTQTVTNPDAPGSLPVVVEEKETEYNSIGINAQFAKRFGDAVIRAGLFETTGGVGLDYNLFDDRAKVYTEVYRFKKGESPQLNAGVEVGVYRPFYLWGGGDFILSKDNRSVFIGAGVRFTDQDIKSLVGAAVMAGSTQ